VITLARSKIRIHVHGEDQAIRRILAVGKRIDNLSIPFTMIAEDFERVMERNFATEGSYSGSRWAELSEDWLEHKIEVGKDWGILQFNGHLYDSLTNPHAPGAIRRVRRDGMVVGTSVWYAELHLTGTDKMPRRNWFRIPLWDRQRWVKILERYVIRGTL
jgi:phage gpG-like protein